MWGRIVCEECVFNYNTYNTNNNGPLLLVLLQHIILHLLNISSN